MAGTIPNLPLSQQFDKTNGKFLAGGRLYFYAANTSTPQSAYKDTGLTLSHPNPIILDASGRLPSFYLADGSIRVRLVNKAGVVQFDEANLLVIGPSSGGGGGSSVDPTTIFQTGDVIWLDQSGGRTGWVRDNGRTIGSATSGASERANLDCEALHAFLWQTYSDTICPVNGGRGATAADDWAANKYIGLPDKRGRGPFGLDDMGNSAASRLTGATFTQGDATTAASLGGEGSHTLTTAELAVHSHAITDAGHTHGPGNGNNYYTDKSPTNFATIASGATFTLSQAPLTASATTGVTINNSGSGTAHNNMPPFVLGTFYRKL